MTKHRQRRSGFGNTDWLIHIAVIGLIVGLLLPLTRHDGWVGWAAIVAATIISFPIAVLLIVAMGFVTADLATKALAWIRSAARGHDGSNDG